MKRVCAIVARRASDLVIGFEGKFPWYIPEDLKHFNHDTTHSTRTVKNICIMGRKTYQSLGRPTLPQRMIFVVSSELQLPTSIEESVCVFPSPQVALDQALKTDVENIFVCGGQTIYEELIGRCQEVLLTEIYQEPAKGDAYFPTRLLNGFEVVDRSGVRYSCNQGTPHEFFRYRRSHPENQYLDIAKTILTTGAVKEDRTGVGTRSIFGPQMEFDLREGFPLLTTKKVFWRGVVEELFWFISGKTDAKLLSERGVNIWDGNSSREFLDKRGLKHYREGDVGPVYGFQWRHWGAGYEGCDGEYEGKGIDQLRDVVKQIRETPESRRIIVSAWNVSELERVALPSCHILFQFNVDEEFLDLKMYQRSADWFLGVPFNVASYALLLTLTAKLANKKPRKLILTFGDTHLYSTHLEQTHQQLLRNPLPLPRLDIRDRQRRSWDDFSPDDVLLLDYQSHDTIKAQMAV